MHPGPLLPQAHVESVHRGQQAAEKIASTGDQRPVPGRRLGDAIQRRIDARERNDQLPIEDPEDQHDQEQHPEQHHDEHWRHQRAGLRTGRREVHLLAHRRPACFLARDQPVARALRNPAGRAFPPGKPRRLRRANGAGPIARAPAPDRLRHRAQPRSRAGDVAPGDLVASPEQQRHGQNGRGEQAGSDQDGQDAQPQAEAALAHPKNLSSASKYQRYRASPASSTSRAASARKGPNGTA